MSTKEGMKLAAAAIGATLGGKPLYQVVQKIIPMRANWPKGPGLRFHARIVHDGLGRQIEELVIIDGRIPLTATRFYWRGTLEVSIGDRKEIICIPNPKAPEPWPIDAKNLEEAFKKYDSLAKIIAKELETKLNAQNEDAKNAPSKKPPENPGQGNEAGQGQRNPTTPEEAAHA